MNRLEIGFLNAEKYSEWKNRQRFLTTENIQQICDKKNWIKADYEKIKENYFCLAPQRFEPQDEKDKEKWEIDQQLIKTTYELRYSLHALIADAYNKLMMLEELDDSGDIRVDCFLEGKRVVELQQKIKELMLEKHFKNG